MVSGKGAAGWLMRAQTGRGLAGRELVTSAGPSLCWGLPRRREGRLTDIVWAADSVSVSLATRKQALGMDTESRTTFQEVRTSDVIDEHGYVHSCVVEMSVMFLTNAFRRPCFRDFADFQPLQPLRFSVTVIRME